MRPDRTSFLGRGLRRSAALSVPLALALVMIGASGASGAPPEVGPPVDEGSVIVTTPDGTPLSGGGSATPFTVVLPEGATCPGDSASDDWRVQTFMIPVGDDPGSIEYGFAGPEGTQFPLFAADTRPYAHQLLPVNAGPGLPARIPAVPPLTFTIFPADAIALGEYRIGVACTFFRLTAKYWDTEIVLTASADDTPSQFVWTVVDAPAGAVQGSTSGEDSGTSTLFIVAVGAAVVATAAAGIFLIRRRHSALPSAPPGAAR